LTGLWDSLSLSLTDEPRYTPDQLAEEDAISEGSQGTVKVSLQDRWAILGVTKSGKTTFAKRLLEQLRGLYEDVPVYIVDSKASGDFEGMGQVYDGQEPPKALRSGCVVWQPPHDDIGAYGRFFERLLKARQPGIVLVDELSSLGGNHGLSFPNDFNKLLKQGRAHGLCVINLTQEAAYIPRNVLGQTTHVIGFRLNNPNDRIKRDDYLNRPPALRGQTLPEPSGKFGFFYNRLDGDSTGVAEYESHQDFF